MRRSIPEHFKLDGTAKKKFLTKEEAFKEQLKQKTEAVYKCEFCGYYHIGRRHH